MPVRHDASKLGKAEKTPEGFLRAQAYVTRTGVFSYRRADGTVRRELRHPDDVFHPDSLASLAQKPLTRGHPADASPVTADNARDLNIGALGETIKRDGDFVVSSLVVLDASAVKAVESGFEQQLSCGYNCEFVAEPGIYKGERFDGRQTNIRYNHVALLAQGRAGPEVAIRLDGEDAVQIPNERKITMLKLDGVDYEASEQVTQAVSKALADKAKAAADLQAAVDKLQARCDAADDEIKTLREKSSDAVIQARAQARAALIVQAGKVLGEELKQDAADDEIRRAVVAKLAPKADLADKSAEYVEARFDHAMDVFSAEKASAEESVAAVQQATARTDGAEKPTAETARKAMIQRQRNLWKGEQA